MGPGGMQSGALMNDGGVENLPGLPRVSETYLQPWVSFLALHTAAAEPSLRPLAREVVRYQEHRNAALVARGLANPGRLRAEQPDVDEADAMVFRVVGEPSWALGSHFENVTHELVVMLRRRGLIALCTTSQQVRDHIVARIDKRELPDHARLSAEVLQDALLQGNIRTFWMGSARQPRRYQPRSKTTHGNYLEESIDPIGDQGHILTAARSTAPSELGLGSDAVVGTSLHASTVWLRKSSDWRDFLRATDALLAVLHCVIQRGEVHDRFDILAKPIPRLEGVRDGYEIAFDERPRVPGGSDDGDVSEGDREFLLSAILDVRSSGGPNVTVTIGRDGAQGGVVQLMPRYDGKRIAIDVGVVDVSDDHLVTEFRHRFNRASPVIFYASGHSISRSGVYADNQTDIPFTSWVFEDFAGIDVQRERPRRRGRQGLFELSVDRTDGCLFGWVCRYFSYGWLYCDDRGDEFADFIALPSCGELNAIHVKAAHEKPAKARFAGQPYEQVAAQVEKTAATLAPKRLLAALKDRRESQTEGPLWKDGRITDDWDGFLCALRSRPAYAEHHAVIVQPHLSRRMLERARARRGGDPESDVGTLARLRRLDYLLHATNSAVQRSGARLVVVGRC